MSVTKADRIKAIMNLIPSLENTFQAAGLNVKLKYFPLKEQIFIYINGESKSRVPGITLEGVTLEGKSPFSLAYEIMDDVYNITDEKDFSQAVSSSSTDWFQELDTIHKSVRNILEADYNIHSRLAMKYSQLLFSEDYLLFLKKSSEDFKGLNEDEKQRYSLMTAEITSCQEISTCLSRLDALHPVFVYGKKRREKNKESIPNSPQNSLQ